VANFDGRFSRAAAAAAEEVRRYVEGKGPLNPCR